MQKIYKPFDYQIYAENFILERQESGVFLDMGLGKTVITLTVIQKLLYDFFEYDKVLVIAPLKPAEETWPVEVEKWAHLQELKYSLVLGNEKNRIVALEESANIYIINRENVTWLVDYYKKCWPFRCVVVDELSSFKSSKSQRFRALKKVRKYIDRFIGLTGTPAPNGLLDLWAQMYLVDGGKALGAYITQYREKYFEPDKIDRKTGTVFTWRLRPGAEQEIYARLGETCVSMKDVSGLEAPIKIMHIVKMPKKAENAYVELLKNKVIFSPEGDIEASSAGVLVNKLLQLCGGSIYDENGASRKFHTEKLKKLEQLIEEANGKPVLVFYSYKHERDIILSTFSGAVDIKEPNAISRWNKGEIPILVAHPASAGHGLNLQYGGNIAIWYNMNHSLELFQQANKRLHRTGQTEVVSIHSIVTSSGVDKRILEDVLAEKEINQNALLEALKKEI